MGMLFERNKPTLSFKAGNEKVLVVGNILHPGINWNSSQLSGTRPMAKHPVNRIAKYCLLAKTRYGFILTTTELVVIRIRGTVFDTSEPCDVEWQSIAWAAHGEFELTTNLAIWWLVMLGLYDQLSTDSPHPSIPSARSLNLWWLRDNGQGGHFYEHHSSRQRALQLPNGAIAENAPLH
ncbi:hypothetical protein IL306_003446 [Fusarium sp. DS 682]|nr:hypothetical protein IL306_003446 [Fusarium sp. DS 682]